MTPKRVPESPTYGAVGRAYDRPSDRLARMAIAFAVPPAAKAALELVCQLRDGPREDAWGAFVNVIASGKYELLGNLWEQAAKLLGLTITGPGEEKPLSHAVRESYCVLTNRCAWRM